MTQVIEEAGRYLMGWWNYFHLTDTPSVVRKLEAGLLRRLRALQLRQWRWGTTAYAVLRAEGLPERLSKECSAYVTRPTRGSVLAMNLARPRAWFTRRGLPTLLP